MMELTKERLKALSNLENVGAICGDEIAAMAHQLLAGLEQEPVAQVYQPANIGICAPIGPSVMMLKPLSPGTKLYAAPQLPQPAVDESAIFDAAIDICRKSDAIDEHAWNRGVLAVMSAFRACRTAMLQGAEPVSQPYTLRDGWVAVPVDMTPEQMRAVQLNSELGSYASANLSGAYSLFREFWDVAIAAAPQQETN